MLAAQGRSLFRQLCRTARQAGKEREEVMGWVRHEFRQTLPIIDQVRISFCLQDHADGRVGAHSVQFDESARRSARPQAFYEH